MRHILKVSVTIEGPHMDDPLDGAERQRNREDVERTVRNALVAAGFGIPKFEFTADVVV